MNFKKQCYALFILLLLIVSALLIFQVSERAVAGYNTCFFYAFQSLRDRLLGHFRVSYGDVIYVAFGIGLLNTVFRCLWYVYTFKINKHRLWVSLFNTWNGLLFAYLFFLAGWGINYYKAPLAQSWGLYNTKDILPLAAFDSILVERLNALAPAFQPLSLKEINKASANNYRALTDSKLIPYGLNIKPSLFAYFLERMGIEGYYNPFTGEGQVSGRLPCFMLPFVVSHEMAHQAGIAAEGDANLMAYVVAARSPSPDFQYSAALNIWLYVDRKLHRRDSVLANQLEARLNKITRAHLHTLDSLSSLYDNDFSRYGSELYDNYLKIQQQKDGIKSYGNVVRSAWLIEKQQIKPTTTKLHIPNS